MLMSSISYFLQTFPIRNVASTPNSISLTVSSFEYKSNSVSLLFCFLRIVLQFFQKHIQLHSCSYLQSLTTHSLFLSIFPSSDHSNAVVLDLSILFLHYKFSDGSSWLPAFFPLFHLHTSASLVFLNRVSWLSQWGHQVNGTCRFLTHFRDQEYICMVPLFGTEVGWKKRRKVWGVGGYLTWDDRWRREIQGGWAIRECSLAGQSEKQAHPLLRERKAEPGGTSQI